MNPSNPFSQLFQQQRGLARLAVLQPGEASAPIKVTLTDVSLSDTSYECLSYDRTKDDDKIDITVGDQTQAIPKQLESGLRTFRRKDRPRTLWADLLIGSTVEERSLQAITMRRILENSDRTLCWTGTDNEKTAKAYGIIREMGNRWTQACVAVNMPASWSRATTQQMQGVMDRLRSCPYDDLESFNFDLWKEIYNVFSSPYWRSVQCLAEIVLAKKAMVVCGRSNISWQDFQCASKALAVFQGKFFTSVPLLPSVMRNLTIINGIEVAERRRRAGESNELLPMIMSARDADLKDPRECVFSMLPIATPSARLERHSVGKPDLPDIDYSKSVHEVFTAATKYIILERQDLMLWWSERAPCAKKIRGLPSWVPDWSTGNGSFNPLPVNNGLRQWWETVQPRKPIKISDDNAVHLQAFPLDKVVYVSPLFHAGNCRRLTLKEWQKLELPTSETPEAQKERFWRTLIFNNGGFGQMMNSQGKPSNEVGVSFDSMLAEEQILEALDCTMEQLGQPEVAARVDRNDPRMRELFGRAGKSGLFEASLNKNSWGHRFYRTESGRFGMTCVENYEMTDGTYRVNEPKSETGDGQAGSRSMGELMSDPLARSMLEGFQRFLQERDPNSAKLASQMMRGELPHQQEEKSGGMEVGDIVVACIGGFHPYVLRPKRKDAESDEAGSSSQSDSTYEYVGDCYLHGVMDGECFIQTNFWRQNVYVTDTSKLVDISIV